MGEELKETPTLYSIFDWESENYLIELKSRTGQYTAESFDTWLLPCCKADFATDKKKVFFYFWSNGHKLYRLDYDSEKFATYQRGKPWGSDQEHLFIPKSEWSECVSAD